MKLVSRRGVGVTFVELEGNLDSRSASEFESALRPLLVGSPKLLLDFSRVEYVSSAGVRVILSALKTVKQQQGEIRTIGVWRSVKEIFDVVGLSQHLAIFDDRARALDGFGLDVTERLERGLRIFRLEGRLEKFTGGILRQWLQTLSTDPAAVIVIDLGPVHYAALESLRILADVAGQLSASGGGFVLLGVQQTVYEALEVSGLAKGLQLAKTPEEAQELLKKRNP